MDYLLIAVFCSQMAGVIIYIYGDLVNQFYYLPISTYITFPYKNIFRFFLARPIIRVFNLRADIKNSDVLGVFFEIYIFCTFTSSPTGML